MDSELAFNSLEELYKRIRPALITKNEEMKRVGFSYIKEEDIWNYLKEIKWRRTSDLSLAEMVNDILNCDEAAIDNYLKTKLNLKNRAIYFDNEEQIKKDEITNSLRLDSDELE